MFTHQRHWRRALAAASSKREANRIMQSASEVYRVLWNDEAPRHPRAAHGHLTLILSTIAIYQCLLETRLSEKYSRQIVARAIRSQAAARSRLLRTLARLPFAFALFRMLAPWILKTDYIDAGFVVTWRKKAADEISFDVTRCIYLDVFSRHGFGQLTELFCVIDDLWYVPLAPHILWSRAGTLATGASCCDFRFSSGVGQASKSVSAGKR